MILKLFRERVEWKPVRGSFQPAGRSAFRTLGLAATVPQAEVFDAASSVRLALKLGVRKSFEGDAAWLLGPAARAESDVRDAVGRLSEPAQRARERLFWFHRRAPHAPVSSVAELMRAVDALLADESAEALHDAALLALCGVMRFDPMLRDAGAWERAFGLWRRVFECEEFWSLLVAADLKGDYEQALTFGEMEELRASAPRVVSEHVAARGREAARGGKLLGASRALNLLRGAGLPAPLLQEYENELVGPAEDDLVEKLGTAFMWVEGLRVVAGTPATRRNYCNEAWRKFQSLKPRLTEFVELAGVGSYAARRVFEHAASHLLRLAVSFDEVERPRESLFVCYTARLLAPPGAEELPAIDLKLAALGVVEEPRERSSAEYGEGVMNVLVRARADAKLFRDDPKGDPTLGSFSKKKDTPGLLTSAAFWLAIAVACVGLRVCSGINTRPTRPSINSWSPLNIRQNLNFNSPLYNYNIPPPLNLRPYTDSPPKSRRPSGGKGRRRTTDVPPVNAPPPTSTERAPNVNAPPRE